MTVTSVTVLRTGTPAQLLSAAPGPDLGAHEFVETEYAVSGTAHRFVDAGTDADPFAVYPAASAPFTTRIVVRRPIAATRANGTVLVEWLNVSSGTDSAPDWTYLATEIVRSGYAWVGVSAQQIGVMGGDSSVSGLAPGGGGLAAVDAERYGAMSHPGDAFCYDIFGQIALMLHNNAADDHPLAGLPIDQLLAIGESQSAMALTTYVNRIAAQHDTAHDGTAHHDTFDGFLLHSRSSTMLPLGEPNEPLDSDATYGGPPVRIRADVGAPVFVVQTETDVLGNLRYHEARQEDTDTFRCWEIAGTAHADYFQIGEFESMLGCPTPVNRGQQRFVLAAALHELRRWVRADASPPSAVPLRIDSTRAAPAFVVDAVGNVVDGVRTPRVDVATEVLSGIVGGDVPRVCVLFGSTTTIAADVLTHRYASRDDYLTAYTEATDAAIAAGFLLPADRDAVLADANPEPIPLSPGVG